jgi:hypothetical protein
MKRLTACLLCSFAFVPGLLFSGIAVLPHAEAGSSAIERLNAKRGLKRQAQVYLPTAFSREKTNSVTIRGQGGERVAILYRYLPSESEEVVLEKKIVTIDATNPVMTVDIPLPASEVYRSMEAPSRFSKKDKAKADSETMKPTSTEAAYTHNSIQIQAATLTPEGDVEQVLPLYNASGTLAEHGVLALIDPHTPSQAVVLPAIPGVDPSALRGVQTMAEFARDEDKRKRLEYDGTINRDRMTDRNTFNQAAPGAATSTRGTLGY